MISSWRRKKFIPLFSIFLLISMYSVSTAQIKQNSGSELKVSQGQKTTDTPTSSINSRTLKEAVQLTLKDGSQRVVPVITGEVLWWVLFTVFTGTLVSISIVVILGAFSNRHLHPGEKNQFLSEALPTLIEGITIVYIVLAVLLLSILGIASTEGTLSILAGISGYVLGKERVKDRFPAKGETLKTPPSLDP
jgi:ABC-type phosphate/phosphonate transport system permease subunit